MEWGTATGLVACGVDWNRDIYIPITNYTYSPWRDTTSTYHYPTSLHTHLHISLPHLPTYPPPHITTLPPYIPTSTYHYSTSLHTHIHISLPTSLHTHLHISLPHLPTSPPPHITTPPPYIPTSTYHYPTSLHSLAKPHPNCTWKRGLVTSLYHVCTVLQKYCRFQNS